MDYYRGVSPDLLFVQSQARDAVLAHYGLSKTAVQINIPKYGLAIAEAQGLPESQAWLHKVRTEAKKNGYSIFAIVEDPAHPLGGGSITTVLPGHTGDAIRNARAAHVAWEQAHGYDPAHSWEKSATDATAPKR